MINSFFFVNLFISFCVIGLPLGVKLMSDIFFFSLTPRNEASIALPIISALKIIPGPPPDVVSSTDL